MANPRASILIVNRVYPPLRGSTGRLMHDLARHFVKAGHTVTILSTTDGKASNAKRGAIAIQRVAGVNDPGFRGWLKGIWRLYRAMVKAPRHDVIITMSDPPMLYLAGHWAAKRSKSAHIHWCQDLYPDLFPVLGFPVPGYALGLAHRVGRKALAACACVIAISRDMQRHLVRTGLDIRKTAVIENWPDQELVAPLMPGASGPVVAQKELPDNKVLRDRRLYSDPSGQKFRVLYAGSIGRAHPIDAVIAAARILHKAQPDIELVFVGKGPGFEQLAQARAAHGLDNIRLMPPQPRAALKALMESGDVHLITMRDEALGLLLPSKFYAALGVQRPAVFAGPAESDIARLCTHYGCGRVVKPGDAKGLATAIALYRTDADAWFSAHEGAGRALKGRLPQEAFALWSNVVRKVWNDARRSDRSSR
jgi:glycosyltransferase involved in cell wall biosynthesis